MASPLTFEAIFLKPYVSEHRGNIGTRLRQCHQRRIQIGAILKQVAGKTYCRFDWLVSHRRCARFKRVSFSFFLSLSRNWNVSLLRDYRNFHRYHLSDEREAGPPRFLSGINGPISDDSSWARACVRRLVCAFSFFFVATSCPLYYFSFNFVFAISRANVILTEVVCEICILHYFRSENYLDGFPSGGDMRGILVLKLHFLYLYSNKKIIMQFFTQRKRRISLSQNSYYSPYR